MDWIAALRLAGWNYVVYLVYDAMRCDTMQSLYLCVRVAEGRDTLVQS